jgi:hypothetical protein
MKEVLGLRNALYGLVRGLEHTGDANTPAGRELGKYLMVGHLLNLKTIYKEKGI